MSDDEHFEDALENVTEKLSSPDFSTRDGVTDVLENVNCESYFDYQANDFESDNCSCPTNDVNDENSCPTNDGNDENSCPTNDGNDGNKSENVIDEAVMKEREALMSEEEKQSRRTEALRLKELGNLQYSEGRYEVAVELYTDALAACLLCHATDRAILYANRAAAKVKLEDNENAIADCTKALEYNPDHMKARLRRAELYEKTDKLDEALEDYTKAVERDPSLHLARAACMRLPEQIKDRNEKMKTEMLGKLKDLGNMILRPFGLSTENFKLQQDPTTGSYSVNFQQKAEPSN